MNKAVFSFRMRKGTAYEVRRRREPEAPQEAEEVAEERERHRDEERECCNATACAAMINS